MQNTLTKYFRQIRTPFYFYDTGLLHKTLFAAKQAADLYNFHLHYAIKANANPNLLKIISSYDLGADCVSGNEIICATENGFNADQIVFAGVGKTDEEIELAIDYNIFCLNVESIQELYLINEIAITKGKLVRVALRLNPDIDAHTHRNITTGISSSKFGIPLKDLAYLFSSHKSFTNLVIDGLHFHIGSQVLDLSVFERLCEKVNEIQNQFFAHNIPIKYLNLGGGLGIDYHNPFNHIPDFNSYFRIFHENLVLYPGQEVHFEPGRSIVGQCGTLISKVLFEKENDHNKTLILDAGFTELIRPLLYQAEHKMFNISSHKEKEFYDIAGPICESSDYFGRNISLPHSKRGDLITIHSVGAYGEVMSSQYNLRTPVKSYYSHQFEEAGVPTLNFSFK